MEVKDIARSIVNRTGEFGGNVQELAKNILDKRQQRKDFFNQNPEAQKAVNRLKPVTQRAVEFIGKTYLYNPEEKKLFPSSPGHTVQDMMNIQQQRQSGELSEQEARKQLSDKALSMAMVMGALSPSPKAVNNQAARALKMLEEQAKKFDSADDFVNSITQEDLLDLANRDTQRFGRAFNIDKDMNLDGNQLLEEYGDDLRLSEPETYNKLAGDGNTVTVYRAVSKNTESVKNQLTKEMAQIQKTGKIPDSPFVDEFNNSEYFGKFGNSINKQKSAYYEFISDKLDNITDATGKNYSIDVGDYITLNKNYAIEHGQSNLNNLYDIKSKTVPKKDIIWDGNDFNEWIYSPQKLRDNVGNLTDFYNKATQPQLSDDLIKQAQKYKSAEEFVDSQPKLYHGTDSKTAEIIKKEGFKPGTEGYVSLTDDPKIARQFAEGKAQALNQKPVVLEIDPNSTKITKNFDPKDLESIRTQEKEFIVYPEDTKNIKLFNKSQLTDIWNKAMSKVKGK